MNAFTYKGYGRIYTNPENIKESETIIKELSEFEWGYYPEGLVTSWDKYPNVEYVGKFELDGNKFKEICKERNIPVFIFDAGGDYNTFGYCKNLNREDIKTLSYRELKMTDEELQSEMVKIALDASKEGYKQGVLASAELLRKTAELNPQVSETLNTCDQVLEDLIKEEMK